MYGNGEENVMNKKEDDCSDIRNLQGQPLEPQRPRRYNWIPFRHADGHSSKDSEESKKEAQSPISRVIIQKEEPKEVNCCMVPHKRHTPKNMVERVEQLEKQLDEMVQSMHQLITLTSTLLKDDRKAIRNLAFHSPIGQASTKSPTRRERKDTKSKKLSCSTQDDTNPAEIFLPPQN
jgi:hypothetical protein